jgi:glycosyltransferase involved in cell wall biosynthesis
MEFFKTMKSISVIIPVYNGQDFLRSTLESVWGQTLQPVEIVLIDDGSSDESFELMSQLASKSPVPCKVLQQANKGPASSRNAAVAESTGRIIAFLDHDDVWHPTYLQTQSDRVISSEKESYSICNYNYFVDSRYQELHGGTPAWVRPEFMTKPQPGYLPSCMMMNKEVFLKVGPFDESTKAGYDIDWIVRASDLGIVTDVNSAVLVDRRIHSDNQSSNVISNQKDIIRMIHKTLLRRRTTTSGASSIRTNILGPA